MSTNTVPYRRRAEILRLLHKHGPLSVVGLKQMIDPMMRSKDIAKRFLKSLESAFQSLMPHKFMTKSYSTRTTVP